VFSCRKMMKSCSTEAIFSSVKSLMTLEESHFQATKRPNRGFVDARYLWFKGLMTIEEFHFRPSKCLTEVLSMLYRYGSHAP